MGTPFISLVEPSKLEGYQPGAPRQDQPAGIASTFLDAMEVREDVFVHEQGVPAANEFDADDSRCCHWVAYASVHTTQEPEVRDDDGAVVQPRKSSTRSTPIGTVRLVPFPHGPHPVIGGRYWNNVLEGEPEPDQTAADVAPTFAVDRPTTHHDGRESYVKLGRLAVQKGFRGNKIAGLLVNTVLQWLKENPSFFDPSITELGLEQMGARRETDIPSWGGLVCVHAQKQVQPFWERCGFKIDEGMGSWWEEGILHVGMFQRLSIGEKKMRIY
ncbi:acetyltransferase [Cordyceps fumosorosea ARSEF 2679]|uniref:Glucosamine 6-phosphate N-acetyltransferase n=1 Tax=Cordyceps fumosorosea (strain ARSEF 2679) TaxID=1081104 RepID=A0A167VVY8_CORFA|nr:acetyltransferase [Cordyceps fumosorosea ARSEF 2679]OAA63039.1 acetyltransferase [Cordyceps fumosorosea ARSEF 2679]